MVEMTGFEPATSASRTQRSTKLSHISVKISLHLAMEAVWLGWKDLNPRNGGVRIHCLTAWLHPSDLTKTIIAYYFAFVKRFLKIFKYFLPKSLPTIKNVGRTLSICHLARKQGRILVAEFLESALVKSFSDALHEGVVEVEVVLYGKSACKLLA